MQAGPLRGPGPLGSLENVRFFHPQTEQMGIMDGALLLQLPVEGDWGKVTIKFKLISLIKKNALPLSSSFTLDLSLSLWGLSFLCVNNNNDNSTCLPG